jgi:hypothetical protein
VLVEVKSSSEMQEVAPRKQERLRRLRMVRDSRTSSTCASP